MSRDYAADLVTRETLCDAIRAMNARIAAHPCADGKPIAWRCDPFPHKSDHFQLYVSWPCELGPEEHKSRGIHE